MSFREILLLLYFKYISGPQTTLTLYFIAFTSLSLHKYPYFCLGKECAYFCHFL